MYRLIVSDTVEFPVRFVVRDGTTERTFGFTLRARRADSAVMLREMQDSAESLDAFLQRPEYGITMVDWIGQPPLADAEGKPAPAGADALAVRYQVSGLSALVLRAYHDAIGAKARAGN